MRSVGAVVLAAAAMFHASGASAHRIDEYLQATIISVQHDRVLGSMRLIPGVLVAPAIIAAIDGNQYAYVQRVLQDLSIESDGKPLTPMATAWTFPTQAEMRDGVGEILIDYAAELPSGGKDHALRIANHHFPATSVYLMNAVVPEEASLHITAQRRNESQSVYELDYEDSGVSAPVSVGAVAPDLDYGQIRGLFKLGMHHIAEGTDHLLFLLCLLLPAPLWVVARR